MSLLSFRRGLLRRWGRWVLVGLLAALVLAVIVGTLAGRPSLKGPHPARQQSDG